VRALIVLVASCGFLLWAARVVFWETKYPALNALQQLGPKASKAIPRLRELRKRGNLFVRQGAGAALAALGADA
jgi:hypothetical protein